MTNEELLNVLKDSFKSYLEKETSRSTAKLKSLHGYIAQDLKNLLGENFSIKAQGFLDDKEEKINGRYYNKKVDITICYNDKPIAGYSLKFVMRNYSQNSNNYFENMLGETANIRSATIPYFQIFITFDRVPYYEKDGGLKKYEDISTHHLQKYIALSNDCSNVFYHTPDKTLLLLLSLKEPNYKFKNVKEYCDYYLSNIKVLRTIN